MKAQHVWVVAPTAAEAQSAIISRGLTLLYNISVATNRDPDPLKGQSVPAHSMVRVNENDWSTELRVRADQAVGRQV